MFHCDLCTTAGPDTLGKVECESPHPMGNDRFRDVSWENHSQYSSQLWSIGSPCRLEIREELAVSISVTEEDSLSLFLFSIYLVNISDMAKSLSVTQPWECGNVGITTRNFFFGGAGRFCGNDAYMTFNESDSCSIGKDGDPTIFKKLMTK